MGTSFSIVLRRMGWACSMLRFDFERIEGPEDSRQANFELLSNILLARLFPTLRPVDGAGGDEGLDSFLGDLDGEAHVFQYKYFVDRMRAPQRRQVERSLEQACNRHTVLEWTLLAPMEMNPSEQRWFDSLGPRFPDVQLRFWGKARLLAMMLDYPELIAQFSPANQPIIQVLVNSSLRLDESSVEEIASAISSSINKIEASLAARPAIMATADTLKRASRLKILIWGPGPGAGDLYAKRLQIKAALESQGHTVVFSEDEITPDLLERTGLNLSVAEYLEAMSFDYVVCLMASPGAIGEVHDFAHKPGIATKMTICIDQDHEEGYSAHTVLRVFEGLHGRIDWFKTPEDIRDCHLATRVVSQVTKLAEARQWSELMEQ